MDLALRNKLWNLVDDSYFGEIDDGETLERAREYLLIKSLWHIFFKLPLDSIGRYWHHAMEKVRGAFFKSAWNEVYDFIEFIVEHDRSENRVDEFVRGCNAAFEQEKGGYRFVGHKITPITDETEVAEIDAAQKFGGIYSPVSKHFQKATVLLADRKAPDYRNSVKESVSAIEALCSIIAGKKSTLGEALKKLHLPIHPALEAAFSKIYGYTSDANGIRHAMLDEGKVEYEEAKFMLVSCAAFSHYLVGVASKVKA